MKRYIDADKLRKEFIVSGLFDPGELGVILPIIEEQPILEVPTPHGDLIDKGALLQDLLECELEIAQNGYVPKYSDAFDEVELAIPIIKAEDRNDSGSKDTEDIRSRFQTWIAGEWQ